MLCVSICRTQLLHVQHEYERQVSQLTKSIATQEEMMRRGEDEKHSLLQDLSAVRDLCTKLEASKDALQRQVTAKTLDQEKVNNPCIYPVQISKPFCLAKYTWFWVNRIAFEGKVTVFHASGRGLQLS